MAAAASESAFFFISCEPRLSLITAELFRSESCASAEDVDESMAAAVTWTVSAKRDIVSPTFASMARDPGGTSTLMARVS